MYQTFKQNLKYKDLTLKNAFFFNYLISWPKQLFLQNTIKSKKISKNLNENEPTWSSR